MTEYFLVIIQQQKKATSSTVRGIHILYSLVKTIATVVGFYDFSDCFSRLLFFTTADKFGSKTIYKRDKCPKPFEFIEKCRRAATDDTQNNFAQDMCELKLALR